MEMEKIPQAGYTIEGLWIAGLQRNLTLKNLLFPVKLISSLARSRKILKDFKPDLAIGTGGYASASVLKVASMQNIPCLIQEQNSHAGITNKWLAKAANTICTAYEGMEAFFPKEKIVQTGNPVRQDLIDVSNKRSEAQLFYGLATTKKTILILGGSLGARTINELVKKALPYFIKQEVQVLWQCGKFYEDQYKSEAQEVIHVLPFINRMDLAYAAADIIVSRAGALSVSELCIVGKPVIFIPSPNVAEDHQTKNALSITKKDAAILIKENNASALFEQTVDALLKDDAKQEALARNIKQLAKPKAAQAIVDEIEKLLANKQNKK